MCGLWIRSARSVRNIALTEHIGDAMRACCTLLENTGRTTETVVSR